MLTLPSGARMFMAMQPVDLRRSYDGLCAIVEGPSGARLARLARETSSSFVFTNRRANQVRNPLLGPRRLLHPDEAARGWDVPPDRRT